MNVIEQNSGKKIAYSITKNTICFDDALSLNLEKYERDDEYVLYIYSDRTGCLLSSISPDLCYAAKITVPPRRYMTKEKAVYEDNMPVVQSFPVPFCIQNCTLTLWTTGQEE